MFNAHSTPAAFPNVPPAHCGEWGRALQGWAQQWHSWGQQGHCVTLTSGTGTWYTVTQCPWYRDR